MADLRLETEKSSSSFVRDYLKAVKANKVILTGYIFMAAATTASAALGFGDVLDFY